MRRLAHLGLGAILLLGAPLMTGCGAAATPGPAYGDAPAPAPLPVDDAAFATRLVEVLRDGSTTEERRRLVLGVAARQLAHAAARFERGADRRALASVFGAMYLFRPGEISPAIFEGEGGAALDGAIRIMSGRGDDGRARVLLTARAESARGAERERALEHVAALDRWALDIRTGSPIERAAEAQTAAVARATLDARAIPEAVRATGAWIDLAIDHNVAFRQTGRRPSPEEQLSSVRALEVGALDVVALLLRWGDLGGAVSQIESSSVRRIVDPDFFAQLHKANERDDAEAFRVVYVSLHEQTGGRVGGDLGIEPTLLEAASFGVLVEAYRRDPEHLATCVELSRALTSLGLSEAVPLVLASGVSGASSDGAEAALRTFVEALEADAEADDFAGAARTIDASGPLLAAAREAIGEETASPGVADVHYRMASVAVRGGRLAQARPLLATAVREQPTAGGRLLLAMVERQSGRGPDALALASQVASDRSADPLEVADAWMLTFEIRRDAGERAQAEAALGQALGATEQALGRKRGNAYRVRGLRTMGRVLAAHGDGAGAARAYARALDEVSGDRALFGATMLQAVGAALVAADLDAARRALARGVEAGVSEEDLVYGALWLGLLEEVRAVPPDRGAARILERASSSSTWTGRLAAWRRGRLTDAELERAALTEQTRVEAAFYAAMARRVRGSDDPAPLRAVAASPVIDLMEVQLARDLLAPRTQLTPPRVVIP